MKQAIIAIVSLFMFTGINLVSAEEINLSNVGTTVPPTRPRVNSLMSTSSVSTSSVSTSFLSVSTSSVDPVSASVENDELVVVFDVSVGTALITVTESATGNVVHYSTLDTSVNPESYIPVDMWESGRYTLKIEYGRVKLEGKFNL